MSDALVIEVVRKTVTVDCAVEEAFRIFTADAISWSPVEPPPIRRGEGATLKTFRGIRIATVFRDGPAEFLKMIAVHELAHMKEADHDKAFYQLCTHMAPDYHQLEFDVRLYLTHLEAKPR